MGEPPRVQRELGDEPDGGAGRDRRGDQRGRERAHVGGEVPLRQVDDRRGADAEDLVVIAAGEGPRGRREHPNGAEDGPREDHLDDPGAGAALPSHPTERVTHGSPGRQGAAPSISIALPTEELMAQIEFARPDGEKASGYLAIPNGPARGGVVVVQEWWGVTDQIRGVCDRLAREGYRALAPDLYDGVVAKNAEEANAKMSSLDFPRAVTQYVRGAAQHLKADGGKVGVLGFCMGGAITLLSSAMVPEADAAVCYYGIPPGFDPASIKTPLLAHFAKQDDWCTPANVDKLEEALEAAGKEYELYRYDAKHAFANEKRPEVHDPVKTEQAWDRSIVFLRKQLG